MKDMPPSAQEWYNLWISQSPESFHPCDLERFYMFVYVLLRNARKERSHAWLEENLREDCKVLSEKNILDYGDIYEHIRRFMKISRSPLAIQDAQRRFREPPAKS